MPAQDATGIAEVTVRGQTFSVDLTTYISNDSARASFSADCNGKKVSSDTLEGLRIELQKETKRQSVKLSIPFSILQPVGYGSQRRAAVRDGVITGLHGGTGNALIRWADGSTDQLGLTGSSGTYMKQLSEAEKERLLALRAAYDNASAELEAFRNEYALDARRAVKDALDKEV